MDFDDFFDDIEAEDFAIIGGAVGYFEEERQERKLIERELEIDDPCNEDDYEEFIP